MYFTYEEMIDLDNEVEFTLFEKTEGHYDNETGKFFPGSEKQVPARGVITYLSERELQYYDAGTYTTEDMKVYSKKNMKNGQKIKFDGQSYEIQRKKFNKGFANFGTFIVKKQVGS